MDAQSSKSTDAAQTTDNTSLPVVNNAPTRPAADVAINAAPEDGVINEHSNLMADDVDVIEKDWVAKAKLIVHKTSDDPYEQVEELSKMRSDYMKKRYDKDLPTSIRSVKP